MKEGGAGLFFTHVCLGFRFEPALRHAPWEAEHERRNQHDHDSQKDYNQVCQDQ